MTDVRIKEFFSLEGVTMDFLLRDNGLLDEREELATAARVALGTDRLASSDEILPDPDSTDRKGWWGDLDAEEIWGGWPIGCKNWLLTRAKITTISSSEGSTLSRAKQYTQDALQPFIDKRIVSQISIQAARTELERIVVSAQLYRGPLVEIDLNYQLLWQEETVIDDASTLFIAPPISTNIQITIPYQTLTITPTTSPNVSSAKLPFRRNDWSNPNVRKKRRYIIFASQPSTLVGNQLLQG